MRSAFRESSDGCRGDIGREVRRAVPRVCRRTSLVGWQRERRTCTWPGTRVRVVRSCVRLRVLPCSAVENVRRRRSQEVYDTERPYCTWVFCTRSRDRLFIRA